MYRHNDNLLDFSQELRKNMTPQEKHHTPENFEADKKRDKDLLLKGIKVLRYSNTEIDNDFYAVCKNILFELGLDEGALL